MTQQQIRFVDGESYDRTMGVWSRLVGDRFLDWLMPAAGRSWIDVGCGTGAFSELLAQRCQPGELHGVDPSEAQIAYACARAGMGSAQFRQGDAMALPFPDDRFDAAVMALVIFFVPDPARSVAEMARVVRPGGTVAAYVWDIFNGGDTLAPIRRRMGTMGLPVVLPPRVEATRPEVLRALWEEAGLERVETLPIAVARRFVDFDDFWGNSTALPAMTAALAGVGAEVVGRLRDAVRADLPADAAGGFTYSARAHAIKGCVPAMAG